MLIKGRAHLHSQCGAPASSALASGDHMAVLAGACGLDLACVSLPTLSVVSLLMTGGAVGVGAQHHPTHLLLTAMVQGKF